MVYFWKLTNPSTKKSGFGIAAYGQTQRGCLRDEVSQASLRQPRKRVMDRKQTPASGSREGSWEVLGYVDSLVSLLPANTGGRPSGLPDIIVAALSQPQCCRWLPLGSGCQSASAPG